MYYIEPFKNRLTLPIQVLIQFFENKPIPQLISIGGSMKAWTLWSKDLKT
jgi:hypothetical protein